MKATQATVLDDLRHLMVEDGDCLRWIAGLTKQGHPSWRIDGKPQLVRRALWAQANGPIPADRVVRLTCGMPRCCNIEHCVLTTRQAVAAECGRRGLMSGIVRSANVAAAKRASPRAKLTAEKVAEIRASDESGKALGARYGICQKTVCNIKRGLIWRDYSNPWLGLST